MVLIQSQPSGPGIAASLEPRVRPGWRTRFAPAPTGWLHLGHAVNAIFVWGLSRALDGRVILRIEDHDRGRCRPEYEAGLLADLDWLGLEADNEPTSAFGSASAYRQSDRSSRYDDALRTLAASASGLVYPCRCSRREIEQAAGGAAASAETRYPGTCRDLDVDPQATPARRARLESADEHFDDAALGPRAQNPASQCGDLLLRNRAGNWTYQFAVVVDDIDQRIDAVIRGADLLESTGRQIALARLLGRATPPIFAHHPLVLRSDGTKLSKRDGDTGIRDLRAAGWSPARVLGEAARLVGLQEGTRSLSASDLAGLFVP